MKIKVENTNRIFSASLHFAVLDEQDQLQIASFAGTETAVKAIQASIIEGYSKVKLVDEKGIQEAIIIKSNGKYKKMTKRAGDIVSHGIIMTTNAVFDTNSNTPVILAEDGNLKKAIGHFLCLKYALPQIWEDQYCDFLPFKAVKKLKVIVNPQNKKWQNLQAASLTFEITEELVLNVIGDKLKQGVLQIPKPETELPPSRFEPTWTLKEYLINNAQVLASQLKKIRPYFVPGVDQLDKAIGEMARVPFPAQAFVIQGAYNALAEKNTVFIGTDMGTGKSIMSTGIVHLLHQNNPKKSTTALLMAPSMTIPKWAKHEIKDTIPYAKCRIIDSTSDAARYLREVRNGYKPDGLEFVLVGTDRAKLGPDPWCSAIWKRVKGQYYYNWHCPDCGEELTIENKDTKEEVPTTWEDIAKGTAPQRLKGLKNKNGIPVDYRLKWNTKEIKLRKCPHCGTPLWRPALKSRGETKNQPRWYICTIFKKLKKHFDVMVADEIHQVKAEDSGRGYSFAQMVKSSKKVLALTGTLVNGMSSSIKEILWRTNASELIKDGFDHQSGKISWVKRYGVLKEIEKVTDLDQGVITKRKRNSEQPKEEPGISPALVARYLLDKAVFMELSDLGLPLVPKVESVEFIDMDEEHGAYYRNFHNAAHKICATAAMMGAKGAFSKFIPATINYGDRPDLGAYLKIGKEKDGERVTAPEIDGYHAKERWLIKKVKEELAENRGVIIYANYTGGFKAQYRIAQILEENGIESEILNSSVQPKKRSEWLQKREERNKKVIITNIRLVEVGLDLIFWKTIIVYQSNYDVNIVRQATSRHWRIGQDEACETIYPVYNGTQQMAQFLSVMNKRAQAMMVEGKLDKSELAQYGNNVSSTAADLAKCLANTDIAKKWTELAEKDKDKKLEIIDEGDIKGTLKLRMLELANKTRRMCGVSEKPIETESVDAEFVDIFNIPQITAPPTDTKTIEPVIEIVPQKSKEPQVSFASMWDEIMIEPKNIKVKRKAKEKNKDQISLFDLVG